MPKDSRNVAQAFGYTPEQLQAIPAESNMGLSCGNPVAAASIKEVFVDRNIFLVERLSDSFLRERGSSI